MNIDVKKISAFRTAVYSYYRAHKRSHLPWRQTTNSYHIVVSEVMLQQTQVDRVIPKYASFIQRFPTFRALARAPLSDVLKQWQGLGYYRRAKNLKALAEQVIKNGFPKTLEELRRLPGIGPATAASILVYAFNLPYPFIETNVRAVFIHHFFKNTKSVSDKQLMPFVVAALDTSNPRAWYSALMDYAIHIKKTFNNPARHSAHHAKQSAYEGSNRQLRAKILTTVVEYPGLPISALAKKIQMPKQKVEPCLAQLIKDGFIVTRQKRLYCKD